jgi:DNA primase
MDADWNSALMRTPSRLPEAILFASLAAGILLVLAIGIASVAYPYDLNYGEAHVADQARRAIQAKDAAIIVEGYMDAVLLIQFGFENVVATLGTAMTDAHVKLLRPLASTVYLCFDSDEAGLRAADRAAEVALRTQIDVRVVVLKGYKDPADCVVQAGPQAFAGQLKGAVDALEFKWSTALTALGHGSSRSRRAATEEFVRFVASATLTGGIDPLQQNLLVGRLSDLLRVPAEEIFDLLLRQRRTLQQRPADNANVNAASVSDYETSIRGLSAGFRTTAREPKPLAGSGRNGCQQCGAF